MLELIENGSSIEAMSQIFELEIDPKYLECLRKLNCNKMFLFKVGVSGFIDISL